MVITQAGAQPAAAQPLTEVAALRGVYKRYGAVTALEGVSLTLCPGEVLALLGPNGAGKTTALSLLLGLARPDTLTRAAAGVEVRRR